MPGFGVIEHTERKTHRRYRTPVNVFRNGDGFAIALTYGRESDWARNVLAANGCSIVHLGRRVDLTSPRLVHDESRRFVPAPVRLVLAAIGVDDFVVLKRA